MSGDQLEGRTGNIGHIRPHLVRRPGQSGHLRSGFLIFDLSIVLSASPRIVQMVLSMNMSVSVAADAKADSSTSAPIAATFSIEPSSSLRTSRQLCIRASRHMSFLRSEKRVGNSGPLPDSDEKTVAIEPSSFGFRVGVEVCVIVRFLPVSSWYVRGSDAVRST